MCPCFLIPPKITDRVPLNCLFSLCLYTMHVCVCVCLCVSASESVQCPLSAKNIRPALNALSFPPQRLRLKKKDARLGLIIQSRSKGRVNKRLTQSYL